ncbi:MAG: alpha/beta fold hydrolase [Flavicella sp.]
MSSFLTYKNSQIHYTDRGTGTAVVLLHGFLENLTMWNTTVETFSKRYRVVCIDLLGHGATENYGYIHTMVQMAEGVNAILSHLKIRKSIFVGHSMGGYVALAFAELYPENIKGLCLMNSTSRADSESKKVQRDRAIAVVKENHKSFVRNSIPMLFRPKNRKLFREAISEVKKVALQTSKQGIVAALEGMKIRQDREVLLHFGPYPKLMIIGEKDPVLKLHDLLDQVENTNVTVVRLSEGHMSHIENKSEYLKALTDFFKAC